MLPAERQLRKGSDASVLWGGQEGAGWSPPAGGGTSSRPRLPGPGKGAVLEKSGVFSAAPKDCPEEGRAGVWEAVLRRHV